MSKKLQAVTAIMLAVLLLTTALPFSVSAAVATQDSVGASSGTTGNCTWTLDDNGVLTIHYNGGYGTMKNYFSSRQRDEYRRFCVFQHGVVQQST